MSSINFQEYVSYLDTHNAEQKLIPPGGDNNPTNDIIIPTNFTSRLNMAQLSLGSLEIPLTQYNIEPDWKTLYFDEGIDLYVMNYQQESLVQFTIDENGTSYTAQLPPRLNPIIQISNVGPTNSATFTTQFPHVLNLSNFFNWGEPMKLISTPLSDPVYNSTTNLNLNNPNLNIISPTEFSLSWSGPPVTFNINPSGIFGYVSTPSIPSPVYLAELVTMALNDAIPNHWEISYNPRTGKYTICYVGDTCNIQDISPSILINPGSNSLPQIMGFGNVNVKLSLPIPNESKTLINTFIPRSVPSLIPPNCVQSIDCSPCRSQIQIDEGNYNAESLMGNLARQLNRFYFDPGCNLSGSGGPVTTSNPVNFVYSTSCGLCYTIAIPFGLYNPDLLATYLQTQMAIHIPGISVTWNTDSGQFQFSSESSDFGLEFEMGNTELAFKLGFYPISYRNNNVYKSTISIYYPTKGCCGTTIPTRHLSYVYSPLVNTNQRKFIIEISKTRCISNIGAIVSNGDGTITITTQLNGGVNIAHGYQVLDVIEIAVGSSTYELTVVNVPSYNQFTVELGSIPSSVFVGQNTCLCLSNSIVSNLYFSCIDNDVLCRTLGYTECDDLWNPNFPTTWIPPACFMLDWPQYVLVELGEPDGATHNNHAWQIDTNHTDNHTRVLAKVILYPQFRMERSFPFHMIIPDLRIVNRIKIRILNPDHSLYQFHGRNWSLTLTFHAVEKSINQLAY